MRMVMFPCDFLRFNVDFDLELDRTELSPLGKYHYSIFMLCSGFLFAVSKIVEDVSLKLNAEVKSLHKDLADSFSASEFYR